MNEPSAYRHPVQDNKDQLIKAHLSLVSFLVERMVTQVPAYLTREDIASAAMMGLVDAASRFDPSRGILFKTFAESRIRGAILDEARRMDWFSRSMREKQSRLCAMISQLEHRLGRMPEEEETAAALGMQLEDYRKLLAEVGHLGCISLQETLDGSEDGPSLLDFIADPDGKNPLQALEARELTQQVAAHISELSEKERLVVALYYYEELSQKEIAEVLNLSEGRVSQLHSQALLKLKVKMGRPAKPLLRKKS